MIIRIRVPMLPIEKMHIPKPILIEDLSNRKNHSVGTKVIISLPPQVNEICNPKSDNLHLLNI
jgi:hypothetical protein